MNERIVTTKRPLVVAELVESIGDVLSGKNPSDPNGIHSAFWSAFAHNLATSVHRAFIAKSEHGKDELGQSWPDLTDKTKAYSRPDARRGLTLHKNKPTKAGNVNRPTLSPEQDKVWRALFVQNVMFFRLMMSEGEAAREASKIAWSYVKKRLGATTILEYAKGQAVLLLQRSGRLEKSLRPGLFSGEKYIAPTDQVCRIDQKGLTWGTSVEYASRVSEKRPLWPDNIDPWIVRALNAGIDAVIKKLKEAL